MASELKLLLRAHYAIKDSTIKISFKALDNFKDLIFITKGNLRMEKRMGKAFREQVNFSIMDLLKMVKNQV